VAVTGAFARGDIADDDVVRGRGGAVAGDAEGVADDGDAGARCGLPGDGDVVNVFEGNRPGAAIDGSADVKDDRAPRRRAVLRVQPVGQRARDQMTRIGVERGDVIHITTAATDGVGAKAFGAGECNHAHGAAR